MNVWERQRLLARTTVGWAVGSIGAGAAWATRTDPWWHSFGVQHVGWGVVDLGIVAIVNRLQTRRMRGLADPYDPAALEDQRRRLHRVLVANAIADAGYCAVGAILWRRKDRPRASGAGAAIVIQGAFLLLHDAHHAHRSRVGVRDLQ